MSPEAQRVRDIFVAAVKNPPDQWEAFLEGACAGDEELRRQVSDLLREHQQVGSFLDRPAAHVQATGDFDPAANGVAAVAQEGPGTTIGPYKLLELIGEGGMGAVWMAEQREPVQRKVALKIIKAGMDTRQVVARFEAERQALALMDHPNIAKVFDGGTTAGGRPYFVMELVKGVPITRYCDEHRLTPRERLELFLPVCQAIQHAHTKGIIHRDVKPANVLVAPYDGVPVPKVIDFGVAKATGQRLTERTLCTGFGAVVGTLEYMSPEQAELNNQDIDTRSDMYSLGVLLYELLTGTTPLRRERLKQAAFTEVLRAIREEEPPRPSARLSDSKDTLPSVSAQRHMEPAKLTRLVRGELDWIVMKALEKNRSRRYETANGFALDVQRYLADEPVQACPPSAAYRLRKFVRRNKGPVLAVSLVLLALVAGITGTTWGLVRADKARRDAVTAQRAEAARAEGERLAKEAATTQRLRAENNAKLATAVLDEIMKEARQRLTLSAQDEVKGLARNPERERLDREFLEKGLAFYEQLAQTNVADWAARRQRAKAYANVGLLHLELKNYAASEKAYRQAVRLMEELAGERPDDFDNAYDLAQAYHWFYRPYMDTGRLQPAEEVTRKALTVFDKLAADFPDQRSRFLRGYAFTQRNLAILLQKTAGPQEAKKAFQQALALWTELVTVYAELAAVNPDAPEPQDRLARTRYEMGEILQTAGQVNEAEKAYRQALTIWEKLATGRPECRQHAAYTRGQIARLEWTRAAALKAAGKPQEAEESYRRAVAIFQGLAAEYPAEAFYRQEVGNSYWLLANLLKSTAQAQEAEKAYRDAVIVLDKLVSDFPRNAEYRSRLAAYQRELAENLLQQGKHAEAAKVTEKMANPLPKDSNRYERTVLLLIRCRALAEKDTGLSEADRRAVAKSYADRSLELMQEALKGGMDTPLLRTLREVLPLRPDDPEAYCKLGNALLQHEMLIQAEECYRQALALRSDFGEARAKLGEALRRQGKDAAAVAECREALRLLPGDPAVHLTLGLALGWGVKKPAAVARFYADAFAVHPKLADELRFQNRYNAACAAALAGCGQGDDAAGLDDAARKRLRQQALDWLRADLTAWGQLLDKEPDNARPRVQRIMRHWQQDADFAGVRGDALAKLPETERQPWRQLWADVERTLKNADAKDTKGAEKKSPE